MRVSSEREGDDGGDVGFSGVWWWWWCGEGAMRKVNCGDVVIGGGGDV